MPVFKADNNPLTPGVQYQKMCTMWELLHDLQGGTLAMRKAGERWLPMEDKEDAKAYERRLNGSFLYDAYASTIEKISSRPFSKPISLKNEGEMPEWIQSIQKDVDRTNKDLTQLGREVFEAAETYGLTHVLVDFTANNDAISLKDEKDRGVRAVFVHVKPPDLLDAPLEFDEGGNATVKEVRIREVRIEKVSEYTSAEVTYVRHITKTDWKLWRRNPENSLDFELKAQGTHTAGEVPLRTLYFKRTGQMEAKPPLESLAWMNLAHWQSSSFQRNILRFCRFAILLATGFDDKELQSSLTIGPSRLIKSTNKEAQMRYVEHSGAAIASGERDLEALLNLMETLGLQPLVEKTNASTATGKAIDDAKTYTLAQTWVQATEAFFLDCFARAAKWHNQELPKDFAIDINSDFTGIYGSSTDVPILLNMVNAGKISLETFLHEIRRRAFVSEDVNVEEEIGRIESSGPNLAEFVVPEKPDQPNQPNKPKPPAPIKEGANV